MKVWKETLYQIIEAKGTTAKKVSKEMGYNENYIALAFTKSGRGYAELHKVQAVALCAVLGCTEEDLTAIPMSPEAKAKEDRIIEYAFNGATKEQMDRLTDQITAGFAMVHTDIRNLIEVMEKYWKPSEPKYELKEREQP